MLHAKHTARGFDGYYNDATHSAQENLNLVLTYHYTEYDNLKTNGLHLENTHHNTCWREDAK